MLVKQRFGRIAMHPGFFNDTTTAASAAVAPTVSNNTITHSISHTNTVDWVATVLPILGVLAFFVFLLRLCYKSLREDERQNNLNNHYSLHV